MSFKIEINKQPTIIQYFDVEITINKKTIIYATLEAYFLSNEIKTIRVLNEEHLPKNLSIEDIKINIEEYWENNKENF